MHTEPKIIVGLGEALFDLFPTGAKLGGAPLNMAFHAQSLGNRGIVVSRVGQDDYGPKVLHELAAHGMSTDYVQLDPRRPTGTVRVDLDSRGEPGYTITADSAWDALEFDARTESLAGRCEAVCFGSLAQRSPQSRSTIHQFLEAATRAQRVFDVNLRQDYFDRPTIKHSFELASAAKLNALELEVIGELLGLGNGREPTARALLERFDLRWLAVTLGPEGMIVYTPGGNHEGRPIPASPGGDTVGAGDAAAAGLIHGAIRDWGWPRTIELANALGSHVASRPGACPPHTPQIAAMAR